MSHAGGEGVAPYATWGWGLEVISESAPPPQYPRGGLAINGRGSGDRVGGRARSISGHTVPMLFPTWVTPNPLPPAVLGRVSRAGGGGFKAICESAPVPPPHTQSPTALPINGGQGGQG